MLWSCLFRYGVLELKQKEFSWIICDTIPGGVRLISWRKSTQVQKNLLFWTSYVPTEVHLETIFHGSSSVGLSGKWWGSLTGKSQVHINMHMIWVKEEPVCGCPTLNTSSFYHSNSVVLCSLLAFLWYQKNWDEKVVLVCNSLKQSILHILKHVNWEWSFL